MFILDDHALFREGLIRLFKSDPAFDIVGHSGAPSEAWNPLLSEQPDVLILDYDLGTVCSLDLVRQLRTDRFQGRVLMVTAGVPDRDAVDLIRMGVAGIFHKQHPPEDLRRTIIEVAQGKTIIEQSYLQSLMQSATTEGDSLPRLTQRDRQIFRFLLEGLSNKEIAAQLRISESAVKASIQQLFAKTGVRTRSQLVRIALEKYREEI